LSWGLVCPQNGDKNLFCKIEDWEDVWDTWGNSMPPWWTPISPFVPKIPHFHLAPLRNCHEG
jgi:hypothetical protein